MITNDPQAIDYPYPANNAPPPPIHLALVVSGALRRVCPCDDDRDAKEDDCDPDMSTSDQFSWKQLRNATIEVLRRQKPSNNALVGLYLPCVECMLEACWLKVVMSHCHGIHVSDRKAAGGFPSPTMV